MNDREKKTVDLEAPGIVSAPCEFCGQTYYIDPDPTEPKVMHELPMCSNFETMDIIDYVVDNRKIKQARKESKGVN